MAASFGIPLTEDAAEGYARLALANTAREYPAKLDHFSNGADDLRAPSALHPLFHGSFDWHSCVHAGSPPTPTIRRASNPRAAIACRRR